MNIVTASSDTGSHSIGSTNNCPYANGCYWQSTGVCSCQSGPTHTTLRPRSTSDTTSRDIGLIFLCSFIGVLILYTVIHVIIRVRRYKRKIREQEELRNAIENEAFQRIIARAVLSGSQLPCDLNHIGISRSTSNPDPTSHSTECLVSPPVYSSCIVQFDPPPAYSPSIHDEHPPSYAIVISSKNYESKDAIDGQLNRADNSG